MAASFSETNKILSDPAGADPATVASNLDSWKADLAPLGAAGQSISTDLDALKAALSSGDTSKASSLLSKLGSATTQAGKGNKELEDLGAKLTAAGS